MCCLVPRQQLMYSLTPSTADSNLHRSTASLELAVRTGSLMIQDSLHYRTHPIVTLTLRNSTSEGPSGFEISTLIVLPKKIETQLRNIFSHFISSLYIDNSVNVCSMTPK